MFRNQYDTDVTVWSPQGHLHQIDYAMEAVKQGSACLGLTSSKYVVLCAIKRTNVALAEPQKKVFKIDDHMGIAIAGLTADARTLARFMRTESLNHKFVYGSQITVGRLVSDVADKKQECTQSYIRRPYGVGLLVAGADKTGVHLYQTCPSGNYYEYKGIAIGARSQSARTYLEKHFESFENLEKDELIQHALQGIRGCLQGDQELTAATVSIAVVGVNHPFKLIEGDELQPYIDAVEVSDVKDEDGDTKMSEHFQTMDAKTTDERFYTPRSSARRGYSSASSEDERFMSPRESARSVSSEENEWSTPREALLPQSAEQQQYAYAKQQPNDEYYYQHAHQRPAPPKAAAPEWAAHYPSAKYVDMETAQAHELRSARHAVHAVPPPLLPVAENDIFSAARHNRVDSVTYLLDQGVPVNSHDAHGNTILSIACQNGLKRMAKLALRRGININNQNHRGNTALHFCFAYGYGDTLGAYLISKGADTTIENSDGGVCYYGIDPVSIK